MKKNLLRGIAAIVIAMPAQLSFGQTALLKIWEDDRHFKHSDAGWLIETYYDAGSQSTQAITAAVVGDYSVMNVSRYDESGTLAWSKNIDLPHHSYWEPSRMIVDENGNTVIAGTTYNSKLFRYEIFAAKLNSSGATEWYSIIFDGGEYLLFSGMEGDGAGNYFLSYWYSEFGPGVSVTTSLETAKIDGTLGTVIWESEIELEDQYAAINKIAYDPSGIYQTGYIGNAGNTGYDILTMKLDNAGNLSWMQTYSTGEEFSYSIGSDLAINNDGKIVVTGTTDANHLVALGYSADGTQEFEFIKAFNNNSYVYSPQIENRNNSATYISSQLYTGTTSKIYLLQLDDDGNKSWERFVNSAYLTKMKIGPSGLDAYLLTSFYDLDVNQYVSELRQVNQSGVTLFTHEFTEYPSFNGVVDFATPDGSSFYLAGSVKQNQIYTDQMTSRWDLEDERMTNDSEDMLVSSEIYPNPCSDFTIIRAGINASDISVFDINGRLIAQYQNPGEEVQINTANWLAGIYLVRILSGDEQQMMKLVKE